jgi:outer membrane protein assembly factor BamC
MSFKNLLIFFFYLSLLGCSATEEFYDDITAPDYVNSSKAKRLEVPPDLSELESSSGYNVPGEAKSYKDYLDREKQLTEGTDNQNIKKVIVNPDGMNIVKSGNLRWLVVKKEPDLLWPHIKAFWEDLGFRVIVANKRSGIIETEWMDTEDIKLDQNRSALSNFDKWLDSLSGFSDKRKFRTRVEIDEGGNTEIYISQRSAEAAADQHTRILKEREGYNPSTAYKINEYKADNESGGKKLEVSEQRELDDYEIDSELLTRLMIKLGSSDLEAKDKVLNPVEIIKAEIVEKKDDVYILMNDSYERAWRRLGLAFDLIGFVTEDKDRSKGIYYVRYSEIEIPKDVKEKDEGLIDSLIFWDDDKEDKKIEQSPIDDATSEIDPVAPDEEKYTGIEAPEIKPIDEDYIPEEYSDGEEWKKGEEETWLTKIWPSWGDTDDNILPENEKRFRIRIKPQDENVSVVYIDLPNGKKNISPESRKILNLINSYLK